MYINAMGDIKEFKIGDKVELIVDQTGLSPGSQGIIRHITRHSLYVEITKSIWGIRGEDDTLLHDCNAPSLFPKSNGWSVSPNRLKKIEEEIIETDIDDICSSMPWEI